MAAIPSSHHQHGKKECKCKLLPLSLSAHTAAEFGDLASLAHRLSSSNYQRGQPPPPPPSLPVVKDGSTTSGSSSSSSSSNIIGITHNTSTPLHLAAQNGHAAITSYLLQNGYDADTGLHRRYRHTTGTTGTTGMTKQQLQQRLQQQQIPTPLHRACHSGALSSIKLLLENGSNDMAVDYSIGDEMTPLHKAVKGGRHLAVALLLEHFKTKSQFQEQEQEKKEDINIKSHKNGIGTNDWRYLIEALQARDKSNRTPLDLAIELQSRGEAEVLSVRRWDSVAGGSADWDHCVQLLQDASRLSLHREQVEVDTTCTGASLFPSKKLTVGKDRNDGSDNTNSNINNNGALISKRKKNDFYTSKYIPMCNCDDGDEGDQCKTLIWEAAFHSQLFQSTTALLKPKSNQRAKMKLMIEPICVKIVQEDKSQENVLTSSNQNQKNKNTTMEVDTLPSKIDDASVTQGKRTQNISPAILGQPCQSCNSNTINLFRSKTGQLVCRKCMKASRRRN